MWLRDTGVLGKMKYDELSAPMSIPDPKIKVDGRISVEQIGIGIVLYSVGMLLALCFFIGELCPKRRGPREGTLEHAHENNGKNEGQDIKLPLNTRHQIIVGLK